MNRITRLAAAALGALVLATPAHAQTANTLLNVSYDIARELYVEINAAFAKQYKAKTGQDVTINQSHNGSSRQARSILEGLEADVVTFNQVTDVQVLADRGKLIPADWAKRLPNNSSPYYSLPAFLVRAGNPKGIKDWDDLVKPGVQVIFPNPKTSGNARYTYLAAYAFAKHKFNDEAKADAFIKALFANVPVFDTGGRAATTTFVERGTGDVLITFEAETSSIRDIAGQDSAGKTQVSGRSTADLAARGVSPSPLSTNMLTSTARARWRHPTSNISTRRKGRIFWRSNTTASPTSRSWTSSRIAFPT